MMGQPMNCPNTASNLTAVELGGQLLDRPMNRTVTPSTTGNAIGGAAQLDEQKMDRSIKRVDHPSTSAAAQFNEELDDSIFRCFSQVVCENNEIPIAASLADENCAPAPAENFTIISSQMRKAVPSANTFSHLQHCTFNFYQK
jgi:hypothetical protein